MPASIGVNLRVTGHCRQGGRKYMEDFFSVAYQQTEDEKDLEYAFFGIYDGHGGAEAAAFAKEHLMESIVKHRSFWSDDDEEVLRSIKDGFIHTHLAMWKIHDQWPKTALGLPSTAGTTASIAFIRRGKIYIGHVGDSGITLGYQEPGCPEWRAKPLTKDHKPESEAEMSRIEQSGGKVVSKSGVPRVVWNRPRVGHKGPVRRSTPIDEIPFLAVARSLGDLWSYNSALDMFVVSPTPDVAVIPIDTNSFRCLIFGTDGLYNMLSSNMAVHIVQQAEKHNEQAALSDSPNKIWINPSKCLVEKALERWSNTKMRADNTSVITLMLDPPGPPRAQVLRSKKNSYSSSGLQIETRYQEKEESKAETSAPVPEITPQMETESPTDPQQTDISKLAPLKEEIDKKFVPKPRESTAFNTRPESPKSPKGEEKPTKNVSESDIQINEVSSSCLEDVKVSKKLEKPSSKSVLRKINLRSSTNNGSPNKSAVEKEEISSTKLGRKEEARNECRVLRERKNTPNDKNPIQKKKFNIRGKLNLGQEKKKLLQNVLFKTKDPNLKLSDRRSFHSQKDKSSTPSRSENSAAASHTNPSKSPQKSPQKETPSSTRVLRNSEKPSKSNQAAKKVSAKVVPSMENQRKAEEKKSSKKNVDGREVRKSTLAQKLRIHQDVFKAKLRGRDKSGRKKNKEKILRFKKTTGRNSR